MKNKYNCPICGKVPKVNLSYMANEISCCNITVTDRTETKRCVKKWKKACKLFKKEYHFDAHGLPIVDLNIPMPKVQRAKGSGFNGAPPENMKKPVPSPPPPPKNRIVNENIL